jgi:hypothetical protein
MVVPEASMYEDRKTSRSIGEVRGAGEVAVIDCVTQTQLANELPHGEFWERGALPYAAHSHGIGPRRRERAVPGESAFNAPKRPPLFLLPSR